MGLPQFIETYELVAPDGGYGYVILVSVFVNLSMLSAYVNCYGLIFKDFFTELWMDSTDVTSVNGINSMTSAIGSLMTPFFLKKLSKRQTALIGSMLWNLGLFFNVFAQSKLSLYILQGLQNFGQGLVVNISNTSLNEYFVKKRSLAISISQTLMAVLCLAMPQFLQWSISVFGHRSSLMWFCALSMHMFIAISLMQPVSWHTKKLKIPPKEQEIRILLNDNKTDESTTALAKCRNVDKLQKDITEVSTQNKIREFINVLIDLKIMKSLMLSIEGSGPAIVMIIEFIFLMILPQALQSHEFNWHEDDTAFAFSLVAAGDLSMRILMIVFNKWINKLGSRPFYVFGIMLGVISRIGILTSNNRILAYSSLTLMGMSRCIILVVIILVISESVRENEFSAAIGIYMTAIGTLNLTMGPVLGAIRDYTNSYTITFYIMTAIMGSVGTIWTMKFMFTKKPKSVQ